MVTDDETNKQRENHMPSTEEAAVHCLLLWQLRLLLGIHCDRSSCCCRCRGTNSCTSGTFKCIGRNNIGIA
ncbi:hypothetical protein BRADI_5g01235v3 [Brachypodium distachyon]|uniref:Uncharacterized protein n=1 Tax=Brachypodium distachyon TaxID=15368 RepID=A0A2K2CET5_BRADI|nr:hypothetical protein BRADI_5g01235v3 [Brachypodium distachyon]